MHIFKTPKVMIAAAIMFAVLIVLFNVYDIAIDKTDKAAYSAKDIESLELELVNINIADISALCALPGVGEKTANEIVKYREQNGGFKSVDEILNVSGIGESEYIRILPMITI